MAWELLAYFPTKINQSRITILFTKALFLENIATTGVVYGEWPGGI